MILQSIRIPCIFKAVKTRNVKRQIKCSSGSDYSEQMFDDVDTVLVKYFTFRSTQYTLGQVYEMDTSPMNIIQVLVTRLLRHCMKMVKQILRRVLWKIGKGY